MPAFLLILTAVASAQPSKWFDSNDILIAYIDRGRGEPIVLLHGNETSHVQWLGSGVVDRLAKDHRVIALDLRGFGDSDKPRAAGAYGRAMGLDVIRLLDHLNLPKAHIVGYSLGAVITEMLLSLHPDRFATATLGGAGGYVVGTFDVAAYEQAAVEIEQTGRATRLNTGPADRAARAAYLRGIPQFFVTEAQASAVRVPTLAIAGTLDAEMKSIERMKGLRPSIELVRIPGATHSGPDSAMRRSEFAAAVRDFVRRHPIAP